MSAPTAPRRPRPAAARRPSARRVALDALIEVDAGARANVTVPSLLDACGLDARDRGLVTQLVYGTCRMRRACDWLADRHVRGRTDPEVRAALRLGAYQLVFLRTPAHAAVAATVEEVRGPGRGVVNAVLRKVAHDVEAGPLRWPDPATELSYPDWIVARLARDLGPEQARAALETMNTAAAPTARADGYIQDLGSQWVAAAVDAQPGERVVDLCAAPGGKATAMAYGPGGPVPIPTDPDAAPTSLAGRPSLVVAADSDATRASVITENATRLGLATVATLVADGTAPPLRPGAFDRVLVDAPCSGLGVLRRRPDARWRINPDDLERLAALQRRLLAAAVPLVRVGGVLVYSVCTLTLVETGAIDRWLAEQYRELVPLPPPPAPWTQVGRGALLLPQAAGTDGMYLLRLQRRA